MPSSSSPPPRTAKASGPVRRRTAPTWQVRVAGPGRVLRRFGGFGPRSATACRRRASCAVGGAGSGGARRQRAPRPARRARRALRRPRSIAEGRDPPARTETPRKHFPTVATRREIRFSRRVRPGASASPEDPSESDLRVEGKPASGAGRGEPESDFRVEFRGPDPIFRPFQTPRSVFSRRVSGRNDFSVEALSTRKSGPPRTRPERRENHFRVESRQRRPSPPVISSQAPATRPAQRRRQRPGSVQRRRRMNRRHRGAQRLSRPHRPPRRPALPAPSQRTDEPCLQTGADVG